MGIMDYKVNDSISCEFYIERNIGMQLASIIKDYNMVHFDEEYCSHTIFEKPIVHGMLLGGYISAVIGTKLPGKGCIYESQTLNFRKPAYYGDTIRVEVIVEKIDVEKKRITLNTCCYNQSDELLLDGKAVVVDAVKVLKR